VIPYGASDRNSGVVAYRTGPDFIVLKYRDGGIYVYNYNRPGREHVDRMKELAIAGKGLTTYINQHVRDSYAFQLSGER
jgi:hypothetical protein